MDTSLDRRSHTCIPRENHTSVPEPPRVESATASSIVSRGRTPATIALHRHAQVYESSMKGTGPAAGPSTTLPLPADIAVGGRLGR